MKCETTTDIIEEVIFIYWKLWNVQGLNSERAGIIYSNTVEFHLLEPNFNQYQIKRPLAGRVHLFESKFLLHEQWWDESELQSYLYPNKFIWMEFYHKDN